MDRRGPAVEIVLLFNFAVFALGYGALEVVARWRGWRPGSRARTAGFVFVYGTPLVVSQLVHHRSVTGASAFAASLAAALVVMLWWKTRKTRPASGGR